MKRSAPMRRSRLKRKPARRIARRMADRPYVEWIHGLGCLLESAMTRCEGRIEANHAGPKPGMGLKAGDQTCVPLCTKHHRDWTDHTGLFRGMSKEMRRGIADEWIRETQAQWRLHEQQAARDEIDPTNEP